jgi:hypothetical protein
VLSSLPKLMALADTAFSGRPGSGAAKKDLVVTALTETTQACVAMGTITQAHADTIQNLADQAIEHTVSLVKSAKAAEQSWASTAGSPQEGT